MFANAYTVASAYTWPLIISYKLWDGRIDTNLGSMVVINRDGWFFTAGHMMSISLMNQQHRKEIDDFNSKKQEIEVNSSFNTKKKRQMIGRLQANPEWITNYAYWWGRDEVIVKEFRYFPYADLAVGRLVPFNPDWVEHYPTIKDPSRLHHGTSLCKLGFPFNTAIATFDETNEKFSLAPLSIARFPIEGIFTREIHTHDKDQGHLVKFLETSSPGLKGQSGGPIFDTHGTLWAIQVKTNHMDLGFSAVVRRNGKEVTENQFLNVGVGIHPEMLISVMNEMSIDFTLSTY